MNDQNHRHARLRYTATGALAALAAVGAIYGTTALAAKSHPTPHGHTAQAKCATTKTPQAPAPSKTHAPQTGSDQPFLNAIARLVNAGTITAAQGQVVDREIESGRIDTGELASNGLSQSQLQAVEQALVNVKRGLASTKPPGAKPGP